MSGTRDDHSGLLVGCPVCGLGDGGARDFCTGCGAYLRWSEEPGALRAPAATGSEPDRVIVTLRRHGEDVDHAGVPDVYPVGPGTSVALAVLVSNHSGVVDGYEVFVEGLTSSWEIASAPQSLDLTPYGADGHHEGEFLLRIGAPRHPDVPAGRWPLRVAARSRSSGAIVGRADAVLVLEPYVGIRAALRPDRARGGRRATFTLPVRNLGNAPVAIRIGAEDPEQKTAFSIRPGLVELEPGREAHVLIRASARRPFAGKPRERRLTVTACAGDETQANSAVFVQTPLLTPLRAALLRGALGLAAAALLVLAALLPWSGERIAWCVSGPDCVSHQAFAETYLHVPLDDVDAGELQGAFDVVTSLGTIVVALAIGVLLGLRTGALTWLSGMLAMLGTIALMVLDRDVQIGPVIALLAGALAIVAAVIPRGARE